MSLIRTLNFILKPIGLHISRSKNVGLTYPKPGWSSAAVVLPIWACVSWYFASLFKISPTLGTHGAECVLARALSPSSITLFALALVVPLAYLVAIQNGVRFARKKKFWWLTSRVLVALSFSFLGLYSKVGAVAIGIGAYAATVDKISGQHLIALGLLCVFIGEACQRVVVPSIYKIAPPMQRHSHELLRATTLVAACIGIAILLGGIGFGTWQADAPKSSECKLVIQYL